MERIFSPIKRYQEQCTKREYPSIRHILNTIVDGFSIHLKGRAFKFLKIKILFILDWANAQKPICIGPLQNILNPTFGPLSRNTSPLPEGDALSKMETRSNLIDNVALTLPRISLDGYDSHESVTVKALRVSYNDTCTSTLYKAGA